LTRRVFLWLTVGALLGPPRAGAAPSQPRHGRYSVEVALLYNLLSFKLSGTTHESVDPAAGRYDITLVGNGAGIANRIESTGALTGGRWAPVRTTSWFSVRGRESRSVVSHDHARRLIEYHFRGETFFARRLRLVEDRVAIPDAVHVDDVLSALLNHREGRWKPEADGAYRTWVVRRRKRDGEGPDDVDPQARAELVPFELRITEDATTGRPVASFDMTRFSSWARADRPARIVFGTHRRPELITSSLILGTSLTIHLADA
jgi:hypothetical protein